MSHKVEIDGAEVEVYTADELAAAKTAVESEWKPKFETAEQERTRLDGLLTERSRELAGQGAKFRRLSDEQVAKLDEKDRIIYNNQVDLAAEREKSAETNKTIHSNAVDIAIRARVGNNEEVFKKVKEMYALINLEDLSPEQIATRVNAAVGAIGTTTPDLLASAGFGGGGFEAPAAADDKKALTDRQQEIAKGLGIATTEEELKKQMGL